jgi:SAM-dependent methyltransferase
LEFTLMKPLLRFWIDEYRVDQALEVDSWLRDLLNRHVVGTVLNTFPRTAARVFASSNGKLARLVCADKEGGSYRVFHAMYDTEDPQARGDFLNRLLLQSPAAKAARNRRAIAQRMLDACLEAQPAGVPILVLAIGGGDGSLEAGVIARSTNRNVYYCSVDKDEKAVEENRQVMQRYGLAGKGFVVTGDATQKNDLEAALYAARRRFAVPFDGVGIAVCHGITEYLDLGVSGNNALAGLLTTVHACTRPEGRLVISQTNYHDRVKFVERGLSWRMRLRDMKELAAEVEKAGWQIALCEHEPMKLITMCLGVKSDRPYLRMDVPNYMRHPRAKQHAPARART